MRGAIESAASVRMQGVLDNFVFAILGVVALLGSVRIPPGSPLKSPSRPKLAMGCRKCDFWSNFGVQNHLKSSPKAEKSDIENRDNLFTAFFAFRGWFWVGFLDVFPCKNYVEI